MNKKEKSILVGMILGDAYLQKTGEKNARIRLEHSEKQKEYLLWKGKQFPEFFLGKPSQLTRFNPVYQKSYNYWRWQSNASPEIGKFRQIFYKDGVKVIPKELPELLIEPLSLAVWFMDDGYFYLRDKMAYIYLPKCQEDEVKIILDTLRANFSLEASVKTKKGGNLVLVFNTKETKKLMALINEHVLPSLSRKSFLDPLSTEA